MAVSLETHPDYLKEVSMPQVLMFSKAVLVYLRLICRMVKRLPVLIMLVDTEQLLIAMVM